MNSPGVAVRVLAAETLAEVCANGASLRSALSARLPRLHDPRDRALLEAICFSALRWRRRYDYALSQWLRRPLPARSAPLQALLLAGLAQLDALALPAHAALAATVEAARAMGRANATGLVNALLRRAQREGLPASADPGVVHSHPDWLLARLRKDWPQDWEAIVAANNRQAPLWLRVNRTRIGREAYAERLRVAGLEPILPAGWQAAIVLADAPPPTSLPGWDDGLISVQDGAAQLAVEALAARPGERVLDACAAPGGKSAHLLEVAPGLALSVIDRDPQRLAKSTPNLARLGLPAPAHVYAGDAGDPAAWWDGQPFDAILLDAPCSATGVIRRQPDVKWLRRESDLAALVAEQARLLAALWPLLAPGGRLLYATCSVLAEENAAQVDAFLARHPEASVLPLPEHLGRPSGAGRQRLPGEADTDGFFYACLGKARAVADAI